MNHLYGLFLLLASQCFLWSAAQGRTQVINEALDRLLEEAKKELVRRGRDRLEMEDLRHDFNRTWLGGDYLLRYRLHCRDGYADGVSSARRVGDVRMTEGGGEILLELAMELSQIQIYFERCDFSLNNFFNTNFTFKGSAVELGLQTAISLNVNDTSGECIASLNRLDLSRAEGVVLHTDDTVFHRIRDRYISWLINRNSSKTARILSNHLKEIVHEYFLVERLCGIFHQDNRTITT